MTLIFNWNLEWFVALHRTPILYFRNMMIGSNDKAVSSKLLYYTFICF